jgi:hypothetical protein
MTQKKTERLKLYDGDGDRLMQNKHPDAPDQIILMPDALPAKTPETTRRIRIMWGQHLLEDLLAGRYRTLVCAVNAQDNHRGIISQLATLLPTSQWEETSVTAYAKQFSSGERVKVLKYDMDLVEVLAILRPPTHPSLTLSDLAQAFEVVGKMIRGNPQRTPTASVSFLGARANTLVDKDGREPSFESVLRTMYEAGYMGDVYPSPAMWHAAPIGVYTRYPFGETLDRLRTGGF